MQVCSNWEQWLCEGQVVPASPQASPFPLRAISAAFFLVLLRVSPPRVPSHLIKAVFLVTLPPSRPSPASQISHSFSAALGDIDCPVVKPGPANLGLGGGEA